MVEQNSKSPYISNILFFTIIFISFGSYIYVLEFYPDISWIFILILIDAPLLGYFLILMNSVKYQIKNDHLLVKWFMGSYKINFDEILGYYFYNIPIFEFHLEMNFIGSTIKRNNIGKFKLLSPGIRKGIILEINRLRSNTDKLFISPKNQDKFILDLTSIIQKSFGSNFEEFKDKFYLKQK